MINISKCTIIQHCLRSFSITTPTKNHASKPWHYCSAVGCLTYISVMIQNGITMPVQQRARFCNNTRQEYEESVKRICRYLLCVHRKGLIIKLDHTRGLKCWVDAHWAGSWKNSSYHDPLPDHYCAGFIIMYDRCTVL